MTRSLCLFAVACIAALAAPAVSAPTKAAQQPRWTVISGRATSSDSVDNTYQVSSIDECKAQVVKSNRYLATWNESSGACSVLSYEEDDHHYLLTSPGLKPAAPIDLSDYVDYKKFEGQASADQWDQTGACDLIEVLQWNDNTYYCINLPQQDGVDLLLRDYPAA
ncbi:hypothetical protein RI367_007732 [Sorochytrium milnesiophthora]